MSQIVLALETSCDETAVAILRGHGDVLSHKIASQADIHAQYGGVVPEVASRNHLLILPELVKTALAEADLSLDQIDAFAATMGPGLAAALLVGASAAKGLAIGSGKPFLAINHLEGHMLSPFFAETTIPPHVALIVSGGHTLLFDVSGYGQYRLLGRTLDDAAGEAFDKVAKLLGLPYPGGVEIDRMARRGDPRKFDFPRSMLTSGNADFSFSGLKTSVRYFLAKGFKSEDMPDICASFQEAVVDVLVRKLVEAAHGNERDLAGVSGGVCANTRLQQRMDEACQREGLTWQSAPPELRTDNALMIAYVAAHQLRVKGGSSINEDIRPNFDARTFCAA